MNKANVPNMNISMEDTTPVTCKECDGEVFGQAFNVRRLSPLMSPTGDTQIAQIPVMYCMSCSAPLLLDNVKSPNTDKPKGK